MPPPPALTNAEKRARGRELAKLKNENEKGKEKPPPKSAKEVIINMVLLLAIAKGGSFCCSPLIPVDDILMKKNPKSVTAILNLTPFLCPVLGVISAHQTTAY